jgi:tetratricopeptide (TPR) repeat protein
VKRTLFVTIAMLALVQLVRADELEDSYTKLKDAVSKKDADAVKDASATTFKMAQALVSAPQPSEADKVEDWKQRVEYGKEVVAYTEYALSSVAAQGTDPAKTVELVNLLLAENPKSKYLDMACTQAYLAALGKSGAGKQMEGMTKVVKGQPDNEVALAALTEGLANSSPDRALGYAGKLAAVLKTRAKPEGVPEAEWEKTKAAWMASAYYISGAIYGGKSSWIECDRDMKAALPLVHDNTRLGVVYFYLGLANYQLGKMTMDKPRIQQALKYSQQSAAIPGPMKDQAGHNVAAIQNELQGRK